MSGIVTSVSRFASPWRHPFKALLLFILVIILIVWIFSIRKNDQAENYLTAEVGKMDIENLVTATGILQPHDYVDVGAQVSGQLKKLYVEVGSEVKAGDLLAEIDATVYKAKVDGIRAQLLNQKAQLEDKQAQLTLAKIRVERQQNLQNDDATTKDSVQAAESAFRSAQAQINVVRAQIHQTEFSLRVEEANLTYSRIYAPISGTVASITSRQGQTLNANQQAPTIMRISDLSVMTVQAQVSEADIGKLHIDMPVYFTTLGGKEQRWHSKLNRVQPTPEVTNNVVLYNALFEVPNENRALMTQMSTQVFFVAAQAQDVLVIPASAINFTPRSSDEGNLKWDERNVKSNDEQNKKSKQEQDKPVASQQANEKKMSSNDQPESKRPEPGRRQRKDAASNGDDNQPRPATVQVMDARGNLTERKITIGVSNRIQVQVIEGLTEGELVVSGMRQLEKPNSAAGAPPPGAPSGANAARMMR